MYCNQLTRIDSSIKPRHLHQMIVPSETSCLRVCVLVVKVQLRHSWTDKSSVFVTCKNAYTCLHILKFFCLDFTPRFLKKFTFFVLTPWHGIRHSRGSGIAGLEDILFLVHLNRLIHLCMYRTLRQINSSERRTHAVRNTTYS